MEATSSSFASCSHAISPTSHRLDPERLVKTRILPFTAVPQIPSDRTTAAKSSPRVLQDSLISTLSPAQVRNYFQNGGDICPRDEQHNNPAHLLAIHHGTIRSYEHEQLKRLEQTVSTLMTFYTPLEAAEICMERNRSGLTPWHQLFDQSATEGLTAGAHVIARNFLKAAASPLYAGTVQTLEECPALALLLRLGDYNEPNETLLSLIINTDPELVIDYGQNSNPAIVEDFPTLLSAAIVLRQPGALGLMLKAGAKFPKEHHPAQAALKNIATWPDDEALRRCIDTLCDWTITCESEPGRGIVLPGCLPSLLNEWQRQLDCATTDYRAKILKSIKLLLDIIEDHKAPLQFDNQACIYRQGFREWLRKNTSTLWEKVLNS